jgi:hypothetical protein
MLALLAQTDAAAAAPAAGILAIFGSIWCCGISMGLGHVVMLIVALVQILQRNMPTDAKILWCAVAWVVPVVGPILWWTIGSKQHPPRAGGGPGSPLGHATPL